MAASFIYSPSIPQCKAVVYTGCGLKLRGVEVWACGVGSGAARVVFAQLRVGIDLDKYRVMWILAVDRFVDSLCECRHLEGVRRSICKIHIASDQPLCRICKLCNPSASTYQDRRGMSREFFKIFWLFHPVG